MATASSFGCHGSHRKRKGDVHPLHLGKGVGLLMDLLNSASVILYLTQRLRSSSGDHCFAPPPLSSTLPPTQKACILVAVFLTTHYSIWVPLDTEDWCWQYDLTTGGASALWHFDNTRTSSTSVLLALWAIGLFP